MNARVIAFARHQIITTASLVDLRDAGRVDFRVGDHWSAAAFKQEITRRMAQ